MAPNIALLFLSFCALWFSVCSAVAPVNSVAMKITNHAGAPIELFWVDTYKNDGTLIKQTSKPIRNNSDTSINSYDTHQFIAKFLKPIKGAQVRFTKGPREESILITYDPETNEMKAKQTTKFNEIMDTVHAATKSCSDLKGDKLAACIANGIMDDVQAITDAKTQMGKYRDLISSRLRNYTCEDPKMNSSEPVRSFEETILKKKLTFDILLDTDHAKIWTIEDFITPEECQVLIKHGRPRLARATVAAEDGSSVVSENRKAQQASYNLHANKQSDPLWPLYNRVLEVTNFHAGFNLKPPGQEDFTIIQYNPTDQYTPHCDGTCDHSMHTSTGRVATAVLYCKVADEGGATTFTKADIFVKPKVGMGTFFSYKGPDGRMDDGYTEHSGCPVIKGEKWITTVWMREGVDDAHPWTDYDPNGVKMMDEAENADAGNAEQEYNLNDLNDEL